MRTHITLFVLTALLSLWGGYAGWQLYQNRGWIPPVVVDELVDEHTWVVSSLAAEREALQDSLRTISQAAAQRIEEQGEQIRAYIKLVQHLEVTRDSLQDRVRKQSLPDSWVFDRLIFDEPERHMPAERLRFTQTFNNNLFEVNSLVYIENGYVYNDIDLRILKPFVNRITITEQPRNQQLFIYVHNEEFGTEDVEMWQPSDDFRKTMSRSRNRAWYSYWREALIVGLGVRLLVD